MNNNQHKTPHRESRKSWKLNDSNALISRWLFRKSLFAAGLICFTFARISLADQSTSSPESSYSDSGMSLDNVALKLATDHHLAINDDFSSISTLMAHPDFSGFQSWDQRNGAWVDLDALNYANSITRPYDSGANLSPTTAIPEQTAWALMAGAAEVLSSNEAAWKPESERRGQENLPNHGRR